MSEPFLAEVKIVGFNFAPRGWAFCDGQILPINQNQSLYSLLGTNYGGDGRTSFGLPEMRGRTPTHVGSPPSGGQAFQLGIKSGEETHTLTTAEIPAHRHSYSASSDNATGVDPTGLALSRARERTYGPYNAANKTAMGDMMLAKTGGSQGHQNMQPYITLNYVIALRGLFPSRN